MIKMRWSIVAAALAVLLAWPAAAAEQAGVAAAVRGQVDLIPGVDKAKHQAKSGEDVFLGDEISSFDESGMQLMLLDETVFTIGPNTDMTVDEFVYDPATGAGQVAVSLTKGVLRFVTGKVAQGDPQDMVVKLPVGTIGIRGTIGAAMVDGVNPALVALFGPGSRNNADARQGRLAVTAAGKTVNLTRTGWGTSIAPGQPPTDAFALSPDQIALFGNVMPQPTISQPADKSEGGRATGAAGQDTAAAKLTVPLFTDVKPDWEEQAEAGTSATASAGSVVGPREVADRAATEAATTTTAILDGVASIAQLLSIETGTFSYLIAGGTFTQTLDTGNPVNNVGTFSAELIIDFGARTIGGGNSFIDVDTTGAGGNINDQTNINLFSFANDVGLAKGIFDAGDFTNPFFAGTAGALNNENGIVANTATIDVNYNTGGANPDAGSSGSVTSGPRQ